MATAISLLGMMTNLAGAIGSAVAAAVWGHEMPKNLTKQLSGLLTPAQIQAIYGSIRTARTQPANIRSGVIRAYNDTVLHLYIPALVIALLAIVAGLLASKCVVLRCGAHDRTLTVSCCIASTWTTGRMRLRIRSSSALTAMEITTPRKRWRRRRRSRRSGRPTRRVVCPYLQLAVLQALGVYCFFGVCSHVDLRLDMSGGLDISDTSDLATWSESWAHSAFKRWPEAVATKFAESHALQAKLFS